MTGGSNTSTKKPKMSDSERTALMAKMDADLEAHFAELERKAAERGPRGKDPDGWTEENWEEEMQKHPFFNQVMLQIYQKILRKLLIRGLFRDGKRGKTCPR